MNNPRSILFFGGFVVGVVLGFLGGSHPTIGRAILSTNSSYTAPRLQSSPLLGKGPLVVEVYVDTKGRIQDYQVLTAGGGARDLSSDQKNMLIFTTFRPATLMGHPTQGTAVLSLPR